MNFKLTPIALILRSVGEITQRLQEIILWGTDQSPFFNCDVYCSADVECKTQRRGNFQLKFKLI